MKFVSKFLTPTTIISLTTRSLSTAKTPTYIMNQIEPTTMKIDNEDFRQVPDI